MEKTKNKGRKIVLLVCGILLALAVIAGGAAAVLFMNNGSASEEAEYSGEVQIQDEQSLRAALKSKDDCEIVLSGDVVITKELEVFGDKKLSGGSIIMDMRREGSGESVLAIQKGAKLVLDGTTVDGNSVVNCISVKSGGELDSQSGSLLYGYPYGLDVSGKVTITDILIDEALHTAVNVAIFGEVDMQGGTISHNVYGIAVAEEGRMDIADGVSMTKSAASFIVNYGKMDIRGGKYEGANDNAIENWGTMSVKGTESDPVEIWNGRKSAINAKNNAKLTVEHVNIHDMGWHAMCVEKNTTATLKNIHIDTTGKSTLYVNSAKATMENITILNSTAHSIYATKNADVTLKNITIKDTKNRGIMNEASVLTADEVVIENAVQHGVYTTGEKAETIINNATITGTERSAFAVVKGKGTIINSYLANTAREIASVATEGNMIIEDCTLENAGNFAIASYGGKANATGVKINSTKNSSVKITDAGTFTGENLNIKNSKKQAICVDKASVAKVTGCNIDTTGAAAVYVDAAKLTLKSATINNAKTYGVAAKNCNKASGQIAQLDKVTVNNPGEHGIGSVNAYMVAGNIKVTSPRRCGVYSEGDKAIINMAHVEVDKAGTCGLGFKGAAEITARNVTINNPTKEGVYATSGAIVKKLDNITVKNPGTHGVSVDANSSVVITVDTKYNPENTKGNGVTIINPGSNGIRVKEATLAAKNVTIKNAGGQGISANTESKVSVDGCTIDTTKQAAVYAGESKLSLKNATIDNAGTYAVAAKNCTKEKEQIVQLTDVQINKPGEHGIGSLNAYMVAGNIKVTEPKRCGVYSEGEEAIINMAGIEVYDAGTCGFGFKGAAEITARNVTIKDPTNEGILVLNNANVKKLDNVVVTNPGSFGMDVQSGSVKITVDTNYNLENTKGNGLTIENAVRHGINIRAGTTVTANGTTIRNSGERGIYNAGALVLNNSGVTIDETVGHGIYMTADASITGSGLTIKNAGDNGIFSEGGPIDVTGFAIENTVNQGVQVKGGTVNISDFTMKETGGVAMRVRNTAKVTLADGTIYADTYGIYCDGSTETIATDVTVERTGKKSDALAGVFGSAKLEIAGETKLDNKNHKGNGILVDSENAVLVLNGGSFVGEAKDYVDVLLNKDGTAISLAKKLSESVSLQPNKYEHGRVVAKKYENISDVDFAASMALLDLTDDNWSVDSAGRLSNPDNVVAAIGETTYTTLEAAIAAATDADTIKILKDLTVSATIQINKNVKVVADKAVTITVGDSLSGGIFNVTAGTLSITGTSETAKITIASGVKTTNMVYNNGGIVSITNVELAGNSSSTAGNNSTYAIYNNAGHITAKSVTIHDIPKGDGINIRAGASADLDNVTISGTSRYGIKTYGTVNVYNTVRADNGLSITNTVDHGIDIDNGGKVLTHFAGVPAGTYAFKIDTTTKSSARGVLVRAGGEFTATDVSILNVKNSGVELLAASSVANVTNATIAAEGYGISAVANSSLTMGNATVTGSPAGVNLAENAKILLNKALTQNITVQLGAYAEGVVVAQKTGEISDTDFAASMAQMIPADTNWIVDTTGKLKASVCAHNWGEAITTQPTCTEAGVKTYTCSLCGNSYTEAVSATGHTVTHVAAVAPTAEADGNIAYWYCTVCSAAWEDEARTKAISLADVVLPKGTVASVNGVNYQTLDAAIATAEAGQTVKVYANATITKTIDKAITIAADLAVTITADDAMTGGMINITSGTVTVTGASETAKITFAAGKKTGNIVSNNGGNTVLTNVCLAGNAATTLGTNQTYGIYNYAGTVTAKSVDITGISKGDGVQVLAGSVVNLDNVTISNTGRYGMKVRGTVNIYNTVHAGKALAISNTYDHAIDIDNGGVVTSHLSGVADSVYVITIDTTRKSSGMGIIVRTGGSLNISNVSIENVKGEGLYFQAGGMVSNFMINGTGKNAIYLTGSANATLNNGTVITAVCSVKTDAGTTLTTSNVTVQTTGDVAATDIKGTKQGDEIMVVSAQ